MHQFIFWNKSLYVGILLRYIYPRDAPVGHRRGNNPVEYVFPRDARHRRGNNPVEYVFFIFVTRSHKKQCGILIEV